jgi:hypothetical protein
MLEELEVVASHKSVVWLVKTALTCMRDIEMALVLSLRMVWVVSSHGCLLAVNEGFLDSLRFRRTGSADPPI